MLKQFINDLPHYTQLTRFDKPVGWLLLMAPTLWALWLAGEGDPATKLVWVFALGVIVMRSLGCIVNDLADRRFDVQVERTKTRPLAAGNISVTKAFVVFFILAVLALLLLFMLPSRVWLWAIPAVAVTVLYPFMKRIFVMPQMVLGIAFSFSIPMIYVAFAQPFDTEFWLLCLANYCWILVYDTQYAMSDREDDLKIGVKSTAIYFGKQDRLIIGLLQGLVIVLLIALKQISSISDYFYVSLVITTGLFIYQQWLINERDRKRCFQGFINNVWVGMIIWFGLAT